MANEESLTGLTRSLMLGVSLGAITLTQVGCAPGASVPTAATESVASDAIVVGSEDERQLCIRVLRSGSAADVNILLTQFPESRCIAPVLASLPARVLAGLSPEAVAGVSPAVLASLPPDVAARLPAAAQPAAGIVRTSAEDQQY